MTGDIYQPGPRLPIGQYRITALITGDAVGPETLSWLVADRLNSMAGGAISGRVELIETLRPGGNDNGPAGWLAAPEGRVGPTASYVQARQEAWVRAMAESDGINPDAAVTREAQIRAVVDALRRFETSPYGDIACSADRAAMVAVNTLNPVVRTAQQERDAVQNMTGVAPDIAAYPNPVCSHPTGNASNRCLLSPSHPGDHDDDPPQNGREKEIVQDVLNAVIDAVGTIGVSGMHGQIMRRDVIDAVHRIGDHYGVNP